MVVKSVQLPGRVAIVKTVRPQFHRCSVRGCGKAGRILCDFPIEGNGNCDKPLCAVHAVKINDHVDYCPEHSR